MFLFSLSDLPPSLLPLPQISGMTCSSCVHLIERTLTQTPGVERAVVTLATGKGHVDFDPSVLGPRDIIRIVDVRENKLFSFSFFRNFIIPMPVCIGPLCRVLGLKQSQPPNHLLKETLSTPTPSGGGDRRSWSLWCLPSPRSCWPSFQACPGRRWFPAYLYATSFYSSSPLSFRYTNIYSAIHTCTVVLYTHQCTIVSRQLNSRRRLSVHVMSARSLCQVVAGYQFYVSAYKSLRHKDANMDVLIVLGTTIAYVYSVSWGICCQR